MTPHPFSIKLDQTSVVPLNEQLTKACRRRSDTGSNPATGCLPRAFWPNASASRAIP